MPTAPLRNSYPLRRMGVLLPSHRGLSSPLRRMRLMTLIPSRNKVPLCGGVARSAGVVYHPKPRRRVVYHELRVTSLSLRRSTINVENVVVRLWQSSHNMSAGIRPQCFFYLLDRHAPLAMTKGTKWIIPQSLTTPAASHHPSNGGELGSSHCGVSYPLQRMGVLIFIPLRGKFPFTTDGGADSHTVTEQSSPLRRGGTKCRGGLSPEA